jgi:hypothetical protein
MQRKILFAMLGIALLIAAIFTGRSLMNSTAPGTVEADPGAAAPQDATTAADGVRDPMRDFAERSRSARPTRRSPTRNPIASEGDAPDLDFGDAPFPDEETERAMRLADEEVDPGTPWPIDADGINGAIRERLGEIKECYDSWLQLDPDLQGKVVVGFVIAEQQDLGAIRETTVVESTAGDNTFFEGCVLNVMSDLQFEPPEDGEVTVNYPFMFSSE